MLPGGGCYKVSLAYFLLLYYYPGRVVVEAMCQADGCGGYLSGGQPCYMKIKLTQPNFVELGLRLSLAIIHILFTISICYIGRVEWYTKCPILPQTFFDDIVDALDPKYKILNMFDEFYLLIFMDFFIKFDVL